MALLNVTTTFDIHDLFGNDFDARRAKAWATNNADDQTIHDNSTGETRIGSGSAVINADGTGTFTHWAPGADGNPISWQTTYHFDVPDRQAPGGRRRQSFGPYTVTASGLLTALVEQQSVPAVYLTTVTELLDTYVTEAEAARDLAVDISNIDDTDTAVAAGFQIPGSQSGAYLSTTIGTAIDASLSGFAVNVDPNRVVCAGHAAAPLALPTPDATGQATHPDVVFIPGGFGPNGHKYWMGVTPYAFGAANLENPCLYSSADGETWIVPAGVPNPIDPAPAGGWNNDTDLVWDEANNRLILFWMDMITSGTPDVTTMYAVTYDGTTVSAPVTLISENVDVSATTMLSPSIIKDGALWKCWMVDSSTSPNTVTLRTATNPLGTWSAPVACTFVNLPAARDPWHLNVDRVGGQYQSLIVLTQRDKSGQSGTSLYFAVSTDGLEWTLADLPLIAPSPPSTHFASRWIYRACMLPRVVGDTVEYDIWYSTSRASDNAWWVARTSAVAYPGDTPTVTSPDGTRFELVVADNGTLTTVVPTPEPDLFDWRARDIVLTDGAAVSTWTDRLGSTLDQATPAVQPVYTAAAINALPGVTFGAGQGDHLICPGIAGTYNWSPPMTVMLAMRPTAVNNTRYLLIAQDFRCYIAAGKIGMYFQLANKAESAGVVLAINTNYVVSLTMNATASSIYVNGAQVATGNLTEGGAAVMNVPRLSGLGGQPVTSHYEGAVADMQAWRSPLPSAVRRAREQELATRYGITLT